MVCVSAFAPRSQEGGEHHLPSPAPPFSPRPRGAQRRDRGAQRRPGGGGPRPRLPPSRHRGSAAPSSRRAHAAKPSGSCSPSPRPPPARSAPSGAQPTPCPGAVSLCRVGALPHPPPPLGVPSVCQKRTGGKGHGTTPDKTTAPGVHCATGNPMGRGGRAKMAAAKQSRRGG